MNIFLNENSVTKCSIDEYIREIDCPVQKTMIEHLFFDAMEFLETIRKSALPYPDKPLIKITKGSTQFLQAIDGLIEIDTAFIQLCFTNKEAPLNEIINPTLIGEPSIKSTPNILFCWALAHEYYHGLRKHNLATYDISTTELTSHALEMDADLCATAALYRWAQTNISSIYCDTTIRKIVFASIFWGINTLPKSESNETHPSHAVRIYQILSKLIQIRQDKYHPADQSLSTEEARNNLSKMVDFMHECYVHYLAQDEITAKKIIGEIFQHLESGEYKLVIREWERIKTLVSICSGTRT